MTAQRIPADVLIITVRGSTEPASGSRLLTPIARAVGRTYTGRVRIRSLDYPATVDRFTVDFPPRLELGESPAVGVTNLVGLLNEQRWTLPGQLTVLLGWSQGAQVIGDALLPPEVRHAGRDAPPLEADAAGRVAAVALFGNPTFTAGEPFNAGDFAAAVSGINPVRRVCWPATPTGRATTARPVTSPPNTRRDPLCKRTCPTSTTKCLARPRHSCSTGSPAHGTQSYPPAGDSTVRPPVATGSRRRPVIRVARGHRLASI